MRESEGGRESHNRYGKRREKKNGHGHGQGQMADNCRGRKESGVTDAERITIESEMLKGVVGTER